MGTVRPFDLTCVVTERGLDELLSTFHFLKIYSFLVKKNTKSTKKCQTLGFPDFEKGLLLGIAELL